MTSFTDIAILSLFNNKLLAGSQNLYQLFVYNHDGQHLSTLNISKTGMLLDAAWTPRGNIIYTMTPSKNVKVVSEFGTIINTFQTKDPQYLSVSSDGIIYLADGEAGVHQSTDDGLSWSFIFKLKKRWLCLQAIKMTNSNDYWTLVRYQSEGNRRLHVYSVNRTGVDAPIPFRNIKIPKTNGEENTLRQSTLAYDGYTNIFLNDYNNKAIIIFTMNGSHQQFLSPHRIKNEPRRLAVDGKRQLLYIGHKNRLVEVFKLIHQDEAI